MNQAKVIRGQLRQIALELLPELLTEELRGKLFQSLQTEIGARLSKFENNVKETLTALEDRQKDTLGYLVRQVSTPANKATDGDLAESPKSE